MKGSTVRIPDVLDENHDEEDHADLDGASELMENVHISRPSKPGSRNVSQSTHVRRSHAAERNPSGKRTTARRRSSGVKQPLGLNLSFGNSPSTVRQFRRVSDRSPENSPYSSHAGQGYDENAGPKTLFSVNTSKEAQLGRRAYSKAVGLACQEVLHTTGDQEKREAISRLAEAWSDLEMVDPEGLYHILKSINEKLQWYVCDPNVLG